MRYRREHRISLSTLWSILCVDRISFRALRTPQAPSHDVSSAKTEARYSCPLGRLRPWRTEPGQIDRRRLLLGRRFLLGCGGLEPIPSGYETDGLPDCRGLSRTARISHVVPRTRFLTSFSLGAPK